MRRPLAGMRVLDFTTTIAGPYCARLLADLGAEVIKIEAPDGDMLRTRPPLRDGASTLYGQLNAGKKSIALDLKQKAAVEIVRQLIATADILVENFRPGVMRRLGLDYATLHPIKPDLIYCAISGYGQTGPSSALPAYAPAIHAASGYDMAHLAYQPGRERPDNCGIYIADVMTGTYAFGAVMTAIVQRQATGQGQMVDVSMLETMLSLTLTEVQGAQFDLPPPGAPMFGPVATKDGYIMPAIASERTFQGLCQAANRPDWLTDPRFAAYTDRRNNWGVLIQELERWSRTITTADRLALWQLLAAAYYPVTPGAQQPDSAQLPLAALIRIVPDIRLDRELSWSGLDSLTERTRAESFAVVTRPLGEYILSASSAGHITVVASRPARFFLSSLNEAGGRTIVHDSSDFVTVAALQMRTHDALGPVFTDGSHRLYVWAYDSVSGDSMRIEHSVRATRDDLPEPTVEPESTVIVAVTPQPIAPVVPRTPVATHRTAMFVGGLVLAVATAVLAQEARPDDALRTAFPVDARAFVVGGAMAAATVANFFTRQVRLQAVTPPQPRPAVQAPAAVRPRAAPAVDRYRVRLLILPPER